jgi:hypothetical protein
VTYQSGEIIRENNNYNYGRGLQRSDSIGVYSRKRQRFLIIITICFFASTALNALFNGFDDHFHVIKIIRTSNMDAVSAYERVAICFHELSFVLLEIFSLYILFPSLDDYKRKIVMSLCSCLSLFFVFIYIITSFFRSSGILYCSIGIRLHRLCPTIWTTLSIYFSKCFGRTAPFIALGGPALYDHHCMHARRRYPGNFKRRKPNQPAQ